MMAVLQEPGTKLFVAPPQGKLKLGGGCDCGGVICARNRSQRNSRFTPNRPFPPNHDHCSSTMLLPCGIKLNATPVKPAGKSFVVLIDGELLTRQCQTFLWTTRSYRPVGSSWRRLAPGKPAAHSQRASSLDSPIQKTQTTTNRGSVASVNTPPRKQPSTSSGSGSVTTSQSMSRSAPLSAIHPSSHCELTMHISPYHRFVHTVDKVACLKRYSDTKAIWSVHYHFTPPIANRTFTVAQFIQLDLTSTKRTG